MKFSVLFFPILLSILLTLVVIIVAPQKSIIDTLIVAFLTLWFLIVINTIGMPNIRQQILGRINIIDPIIVAISLSIFPYIILIISGITDMSTFWIFAVWYLLPSIIMIIPSEFHIKQPFESIVYVIGAIILWIGFDHRYTMILFDGVIDLNYLMNAFWMANIGFGTFGLYRGINHQSNNNDKGLIIHREALLTGNYMAFLASFIIVPFGLFTHFLSFNPVKFDLFNIIISFIGIYFTIALQEEMIFRGIILNEVGNIRNKKLYWIFFVLVAFAFGLTHWNNEITKFLPHYIFSATIAGLAYGYAYKRYGISSSMFAHTLIDWIWALLLSRS